MFFQGREILVGDHVGHGRRGLREAQRHAFRFGKQVAGFELVDRSYLGRILARMVRRAAGMGDAVHTARGQTRCVPDQIQQAGRDGLLRPVHDRLVQLVDADQQFRLVRHDALRIRQEP